MVIVVSVLAIATVIVVPVCVAVAVRRLWRAVQQAPRTPQPEMPSLPYGALPPLGRVGALGEISPDANIGGTGTNSRDLYGA